MRSIFLLFFTNKISKLNHKITHKNIGATAIYRKYVELDAAPSVETLYMSACCLNLQNKVRRTLPSSASCRQVGLFKMLQY